MSSDLTLCGAPLTLSISGRARRIRLRADPRTRAIILTVPKRVSTRKALAWAAGQREWIESALAKMPAPVPLLPGAVIPFRGEPREIVWRQDWPRRIELEAKRILAGGPEDLFETRILRWMKREALALLRTETEVFARKAGVIVTRIGIGDPVSRWGSCSTTGGIRYSWRLILAPEFVRTATVAHEVAHRVHMHHGPEFHALVMLLLGEDPTPARAWLRKEGAGLHLICRAA